MKDQQENITCKIKIEYKYYFRCKLETRIEAELPMRVVLSVTLELKQWLTGKRTSMTLNHAGDFYFCMTKIVGYTKRTVMH